MSQDDNEATFSAIIASSVHDMKNSLGMLLGALDEIMSRCEPNQCPSFDGFSHLRYEGNRVNHSLMQLLSLYRISNDQYSLNETHNDVEECLEECFLESQGLLELKGIQTELDCDEELLWYFDRNLIVGMLNSVINNSYKYTKSIIKISAYVKDGYLAISVADDGNGYPESMLHEANQQTHAIDYKTGSTGLGLYFSSCIAKLHEHKDKQGYITTTNDGISGGGNFTIYLP